jgi:ABC-2 type transport system permease protein
MSAFFHHFAYDFKTGIRDRSRLLMFYLFPLVFFFLVGGMMTSLNPLFRLTMIPAMVLFAVMCATLLSLPAVLVTARESGVFRSYRISGVPASSILSIPVMGTGVHMVIVAVIFTVAGARVFNGATPASVAGFLAAALLSYAAYAGIGALIGVAAGSATAAILIAQVLYVPSIILGGLMVPLSILPGGLQRVALLLPATHCMAVFTGLGGMPAAGGGATGEAAATTGAGIPWLSLGVLGVSAVLSFGLAALLFQWDTRASQPGRKAFLAILAAAPYAAAAIIGL